MVVMRRSRLSKAKQDRLIEYFVADRKSTRLNSSHKPISYAVFCLKKKNLNSEKKNLLY